MESPAAVKCTHKGRQENGTWCVLSQCCVNQRPYSFIPPTDIVDAAARTDGTPEALRAVCPDYYTPLEMVWVASRAGLNGKSLDWRSYV